MEVLNSLMHPPKEPMIDLKDALNLIFQTPDEQIYLFQHPVYRSNVAVLVVHQVCRRFQRRCPFGGHSAFFFLFDYHAGIVVRTHND